MFNIRNIHTKEEFKFDDLHSLSKFLDAKPGTVLNRICRKNPESLIWDNKWQYKSDPNSPWIDLLPDFSQFKQIRNFPDYWINKEGKIWSNRGGCGTDKEKGKIPRVGYINKNNKESICFYNGNTTEWFRVRLLVKEYFPDDLEGYRPIPGYSKYLINKEGLVYSDLNKKHMLTTINRDGYSVISIVTDNGKRDTKKIHHLVLMAFKPEDYAKIHTNVKNRPRNEERMVCNHINGIKTDNRLENLEVITNSENVIHASDNGLLNTAIKVLVKNYNTGEILRFNSCNSADRYFGYNINTVINRLHRDKPEIKPDLVLYEEQWQFKEDDGNDEFCKPIYYNKIGFNTAFWCIDLKVSRVHEKLYGTMDEFINDHGGNKDWIREAFKKTEQPLLNNMCLLRRIDSELGWYVPDNPILLIEKTSNYGKPIVFYKEGEEPIIFLPKSQETVMGLNKVELSKKLNRDIRVGNGMVRKVDGYNISFFSKYMETDHYSKNTDYTKYRYI